MTYDVAVIGSGSAAYTFAQTLRQHDHSIILVDEREFGGTCALRGCQAKKFFVANAEAADGVRALVGKGFASPASPDWSQVQALKRSFTEGIPEGTREGFENAGIDTRSGTAKFLDPHRIDVAGEVIEARYFVIATGASPRPLTIPGAEYAHDSEYFLNLESVPPRMIFIGGGYISFEFAHMVARHETAATILQSGPRPLKQFDPDMVDLAVEAGREVGIGVETGVRIQAIEKTAGGFCVKSEDGRSFEADLVISAAGRVPNTAKLDLEAAGVPHGRHGINVNNRLQSVSQPHIYAIGDVNDAGPQLAPVADYEGQVVAKNICCNANEEVDYGVIPSVCFTIPSLASVGFTEAEAEATGCRFRVNRGETTGWPSAKRIGETHGAYKILIEEETHQILGAHLCRHHAGELINVLGLAMQFEISTLDLKSMLWAYPTYTSDLKYMIG